MWGLIIGLFIALNVISTIIILSACIISGRQARSTRNITRAQMHDQMELATAISKLRHVEPISVSVQA